MDDGNERAGAERVVVDAGLKASSIDSGMPRVADYADVEYGKRRTSTACCRSTGATRFTVGDKLKLIPGHCDPTVNLYDNYVCMRNGRVEALWPISARARCCSVRRDASRAGQNGLIVFCLV